MKTLVAFLCVCSLALAQSVTIGPTVFTGTGTMTATSGGVFAASPANSQYVVAISNVGSKQVTVALNGGAPGSPLTYVSGSPLAIGNGVTWTPSSGGTPVLADSWTITAQASGSLGGASFVQLGIGAMVTRNAQDKARDVLSVRDFLVNGAGANCGPGDSGPAIRAALATGLDVYKPPCFLVEVNQYYTVNSFAGNYSNNSWPFIITGSNQRIYGSGTASGCLRLANGLVNTGGQTFGAGMFLLNGASHIQFSDLCIDMNGANNLVPMGTIRNAIAIKAVGVTHVDIDRVQMLNPSGQNAILFDNTSSYVEVSHSAVIGSGQCLSGNTYQRDWTALYSEAPHTDFSHNNIEMCGDTPGSGGYLSYPQGPAAGIEMHNSANVGIGNDIDRGFPGAYLSGDGTTGQYIGLVFQGNHCLHCYSGIIINQFTLFGLNLSGNVIELTPGAWPSNAQPPTGIYEVNWSAPASNYTVLENCVISDNTVFESEATVPTTPLADGMSFATMVGCQITGNTLRSISGYPVIFNGTGYGLNDSGFKGNHISSFFLNSSGGQPAAILLEFSNQNMALVLSTTATAGSGASSLTVASATGIYAGNVVIGAGLATDTLVGPAYVSGSTTVPITINTTGALSGTAVSFNNNCLAPCSQYQNLSGLTISENDIKQDVATTPPSFGIFFNWDPVNSAITDLDIHGNTALNVTMGGGPSFASYTASNGGYNWFQWNTFNGAVTSIGGVQGDITLQSNLQMSGQQLQIAPTSIAASTFGTGNQIPVVSTNLQGQITNIYQSSQLLATEGIPTGTSVTGLTVATTCSSTSSAVPGATVTSTVSVCTGVSGGVCTGTANVVAAINGGGGTPTITTLPCASAVTDPGHFHVQN